MHNIPQRHLWLAFPPAFSAGAVSHGECQLSLPNSASPTSLVFVTLLRFNACPSFPGSFALHADVYTHVLQTIARELDVQ
jgi:hypothetical protein